MSIGLKPQRCQIANRKKIGLDHKRNWLRNAIHNYFSTKRFLDNFHFRTAKTKIDVRLKEIIHGSFYIERVYKRYGLSMLRFNRYTVTLLNGLNMILKVSGVVLVGLVPKCWFSKKFSEIIFSF